MVMVIPESYERVVRLVGEATVELQLACPDMASLVDESSRAADRIRRLAAANGWQEDMDFALIGAAACLMRYRQLDEELRHEQRLRRIGAAASSGATLVVLEQGAPPSTWPPMPSTTLEMHLPSGRGLRQTTLLDESTGAAHFVLAEVALDPASGEPGADEGPEEAFADLAQWRAAVAARKDAIEMDR
jgi:hypothetical protein